MHTSFTLLRFFFGVVTIFSIAIRVSIGGGCSIFSFICVVLDRCMEENVVRVPGRCSMNAEKNETFDIENSNHSNGDVFTQIHDHSWNIDALIAFLKKTFCTIHLLECFARNRKRKREMAREKNESLIFPTKWTDVVIAVVRQTSLNHHLSGLLWPNRLWFIRAKSRFNQFDWLCLHDAHNSYKIWTFFHHLFHKSMFTFS